MLTRPLHFFSYHIRLDIDPFRSSIYQQPISPMQTGQTYVQQPQSQSYIQQIQQPQQTQQPQHTGTIASPMASPSNEKQEYYGGQQQQGAPIVQQQQQQQPLQVQSQYQNPWPLASLKEEPAPVDCPCCHQRRLTTTEYHAGNTTQYVRSYPLGRNPMAFLYL